MTGTYPTNLTTDPLLDLRHAVEEAGNHCVCVGNYYISVQAQLGLKMKR